MPQSARRAPLAAIMLLLLCPAALFTVLLRVPAGWTLDIGTSGDQPYLQDFFDPEHDQGITYRWSRPYARLLLPATYAGPATLELRLHAPEAHGQLRLVRGEHVLATLPLLPGWNEYRVDLPAGTALVQGQPRFAIDLVVPPFHPGAADPRVLGVAVDRARVTPVAGAPVPWHAALLRALLLTWAVAALGGLVWGLDTLLWRTRMRVAWRGGLGVGLCACAAALWFQSAPLVPAWSIPTPPSAYALLTAALLLPTTVRVLRPIVVQLCASHRLAHGPVPAVRRFPLAPLLVGVLVAHAILVTPMAVSWHGSAALAILGFPGILLTLLLFRHEHDPLTHVFLAVCGVLVLAPLLVLALHTLAGPLPRWLVLATVDSLSTCLMVLLVRWPVAQPALVRAQHPYLLVGGLLVLGGVLRLVYLGGAEFQGDEARALLRAAGVRSGQDAILLAHRKGPIEIVLPAGLLGLSGSINEFVARLPFALAGLGIPLGSYVLAREMFGNGEAQNRGTAIGLVAAAIVGLNGFLIAFARIVQYQSVLMLMMLGAVWCCWRFYAVHSASPRYLWGAATCSAVGLLAHYDALFVLPALLWLTVAGGVRRRWRGMQWPAYLWPPLAIGAVLLVSFYLPFIRHAHFADTLAYLRDRVGGGDADGGIVNNLPLYHYQATFYNTTFQFYPLAIVLATSIGIWLTLYGRPSALGHALVVLWLAGGVLLVVAPAAFEFRGGGNWAIIAFAVPLAGLALSPATPPALRTLVLWFGVPFVAESFVIADPRTHFYVMETPAALLIGLGVVCFAHWLGMTRLRWLQVGLAVGGAGILVLAVPYLLLVFVRQEPEYRRVFPAARPAIYRAAYGDTLVVAGYFGLPHRSGWKVIGELYRQGVLHGSYDSNDTGVVTSWYTADAPRCTRWPDYYFFKVAEQRWLTGDRLHSYSLWGYVLVDGNRKLDIYSRRPVEQPPRIFELASYATSFDRRRMGSAPSEQVLANEVPQDCASGRHVP